MTSPNTKTLLVRFSISLHKCWVNNQNLLQELESIVSVSAIHVYTPCLFSSIYFILYIVAMKILLLVAIIITAAHGNTSFQLTRNMLLRESVRFHTYKPTYQSVVQCAAACINHYNMCVAFGFSPSKEKCRMFICARPDVSTAGTGDLDLYWSSSPVEAQTPLSENQDFSVLLAQGNNLYQLYWIIILSLLLICVMVLDRPLILCIFDKVLHHKTLTIMAAVG